MARKLSYAVKEPRSVWVGPPENVWRHWRKMPEATAPVHVADRDRSRWVRRCERAMYGFADAHSCSSWL